MTGQFSCARHVPRENELPRTYLGAQIVVRGVLDAHHILQHDDPARLPKPLSVLPCLGILVRVDDLSHLRPAQRGALSLVLTLPAFILATLTTLARLDLLDGQRVDDTRSIRAEALPFLVAPLRHQARGEPVRIGPVHGVPGEHRDKIRRRKRINVPLRGSCLFWCWIRGDERRCRRLRRLCTLRRRQSLQLGGDDSSRVTAVPHAFLKVNALRKGVLRRCWCGRRRKRIVLEGLG